MGVFAEDIEAARKLIRERGEDPDQYQFTMARNISDVYFSSCANGIGKVIVHKRDGVEQAYELTDDEEEWIPRFIEDLRMSRFVPQTDRIR